MNTLWYRSAAKKAEEGFPLGNGRLGAIIYGSPWHEIIQLNEESIWSGAMADRNNPSCKENLEYINELENEGQIDEATALIKEAVMGLPPEQTYTLPAPTLHIDHYTSESRVSEYEKVDSSSSSSSLNYSVSVYHRELDMENAIVTTSFSAESQAPSTAYFSKNTRGSSVTYTREAFVSSPLDVLVLHFQASTPKSIYFTSHFEYNTSNTKIYTLEDTVALQSLNAIPFCAMMTASSSGGKIIVRGGSLVIEGADEATLYVDIQTAFRNKGYASRFGRTARSASSLAAWAADEALKKLCFACSGTYTNARNAHIAEYSPLYKQVSLSLGNDDKEKAKSMDELLKSDSSVQILNTLTWNYARYLMLSALRLPGKLPAVKSGLWTLSGKERYPLNAELYSVFSTMFVCGSFECAKPFTTLLKRFCKTGHMTARKMYGIEGIVAHNATDLWADSVSSVSYDDKKEADFLPMGLSYLAPFAISLYEYTLDTKVLKKNLKPLCKACNFFAEYNLDLQKLTVEQLNSLLFLLRSTLQAISILEKSESENYIIKCKNLIPCIEDILSQKDNSPEQDTYPLSKIDFTAPCADKIFYTSLLSLYNITREIVESNMEGRLVAVNLLPCLNADCQSGSLKGAYLCGNLRIDITWSSGKLDSALIYTPTGTKHCQNVALYYQGKRYEAPLTDGRLDVRNVLPTTI